MDDTGSAFPWRQPQDIDGKWQQGGWGEGMLLRDYFAGQALAGWLASFDIETPEPVGLSEFVYRIADAMLAEREQRE